IPTCTTAHDLSPRQDNPSLLHRPPQDYFSYLPNSRHRSIDIHDLQRHPKLTSHFGSCHWAPGAPSLPPRARLALSAPVAQTGMSSPAWTTCTVPLRLHEPRRIPMLSPLAVASAGTTLHSSAWHTRSRWSCTGTRCRRRYAGDTRL
ncbi:hypothetical protein B0H10DRAFT_2026873, partial [Mycena sp. CBHHK59/15]